VEAKITKKLVDQLQAAEKEFLVFDTVLKGFALKVTPAGAKTYLVRYRMGGRTTPLKKITIGRHGSPWTPDQARTEAERLLALTRMGTDPVAEKKEREARAVTVSDLCDRFLDQHVDLHLKPRTAGEYRRLINVVIKPALGGVLVREVTRGDVSTLHYKMRDTPRQANLTLSVLSKMFSQAEAWGVRDDGSNPCRLVKRYKETNRERFLSDAEVVELGRVLAALDDMRGENDAVLDGIRLLLLTGCRLSEILALRWADVDLERGALEIRDAKAGGRTHPIGAQAVALLAEMRTRAETSAADHPKARPDEWVLPGIRDKEKALGIYTIEHAWRRIRTTAGFPDVRLHDFRHTVGTYAGQTGANAFLVRDGLGHKTTAMTNRYVNRDDNPVRELANKVGSRITGALNAGAAKTAGNGEKVIPLEKPRVRKAR